MKIDVYLNGLLRFGATGATLEGERNVVFHFATGDRHASQMTTNDDLMVLVQESAPRQAANEIGAGRNASYAYEYQGRSFDVLVAPTPLAWNVAIRAAPVSESAPGPAVSAGGSGQQAAHAPNRTIMGQGATSAPSHAAASKPAISSPGLPEPAGHAPARAATPNIAPTTSSVVSSNGDKAIDGLLRLMSERGGSDLHLSTGSPPFLRLHGEMVLLDEFPVYTPELLAAQLDEIMQERNRQEFAERNDADFAYAIEGLSRFRVNAFVDRKGPGTVIRSIPFEILTAEQLGLPTKVLELCFLTKGLVLVTGPTGSGKSTTLATMIDYVNQHRADHIITIEDPIEFVHENKKCLVNQRQIGEHTGSFKDALRAALREDPDIVLVGEMRDLETIAIAVETAETGHLVFGTLHTTTAPSTIDRIVDQFPSDRQEQIRQMLSESLAGVIAQTLCKKIGGGRAAAYEILLANSAVRNLVREKKTFQLFSLMQTASASGMRTLNTSLMQLVKANKVEPMEAYMKAVNKQELRRLLEIEGIALNMPDAAG